MTTNGIQHDPFLLPGTQANEEGADLTDFQLLPQGLSHETFLKPDQSEFSANDFLLSRRHTPLDELRTELRSYLSNLRQELVGVINRDYEDFIGLGIGLRGTEKRLERMRRPIEDVKQQVDTAKSAFVEIQAAIESQLAEKIAVRNQKATLRLLLSVHDSVVKVEALLLITSTEEASSSPMKSLRSSQNNESTSKGRLRQPETQKIERIASEYNQMLYLVEKAQGSQYINALQPRIQRITETLHHDLAILLSTALLSHSNPPNSTSQATRKASHSHREALVECLKTFQSLGRIRAAEDIIRKDLVRPWLVKTISRDTLTQTAGISKAPPPTPLAADSKFAFSNPTHTRTGSAAHTIAEEGDYFAQSEPSLSSNTIPESNASSVTTQHENLLNLYNRILNFVSNDCATILDVTDRQLSSTGDLLAKGIMVNGDSATHATNENFHILSNVVWDEVANRLTGELGHIIFAAGNPDYFQANYAITAAFIDRMEALCPTTAQLNSLRAHTSFVSFNRRWQLPVYFQLRFKEIASRLEDGLVLRSAQTPQFGKDQPFLLPATAAVHRAIWTCWQENVLIPELTHRFWRLTLQLINRFKLWSDEAMAPLVHPGIAAAEAERASKSNSSSRAGTPKPEELSDEAALRLATIFIADMDRFNVMMRELFSTGIAPHLPQIEPDQLSEPDVLPEATLSLSLASLKNSQPALRNSITQILVASCAQPLRSVHVAVSQIKANNKYNNANATPSYFVPAILKPLKEFLSGPGQLISEELRIEWSRSVVQEIAIKYSTILAKMKEADNSIRRIRGNRQGFSLFGGGSKVSAETAQADEDKVKVQMQIDVQALCQDAKELGIDIEQSKELLELRTVANGTTK